MFIKSNYRDYYDWAYAEESNYADVTYYRTSLVDTNSSSQTIEVISNFYSRYVENQTHYQLDTTRFNSMAGIVVSDTFYACIKNSHSDKWELLKYKEVGLRPRAVRTFLTWLEQLDSPYFLLGILFVTYVEEK